MTNRMLRRRKFWLLVLCLCLLLPSFLPLHFYDLSREKLKWEVFDPALVDRLRSVDAVLTYTDSLAAAEEVMLNTLDYGILINRIINNRFYHGYSHYSLNENWTAAVAGKIIWHHLSAIVLPDDILKYPMAACSQQSIVMMECLRRKGIPFRTVGFDHHFAIEAYFDGWYYFDANMEPDFTEVKRESVQTLLDNGKLQELYKNAMSPAEVDYFLANPYYGEINVLPAANATIFHKVMKALSRTLWLLPLVAFVFPFFARRISFLQQRERSALTAMLKKNNTKTEFS